MKNYSTTNEGQHLTAVWRNGGCSASYDSFVVGSGVVLRLNFCAKNPPLRQAANRLLLLSKTETFERIDNQKIMTKDFSILINLYAQDKIELEIILQVFNELTAEEKRSELGWLRMYIEQSHPSKDSIIEAIKNIPLKRTTIPIVILKTNEWTPALRKICELPENELEKATITLLTLFRHTDTKRRETFCKDGCNHEWHNIDKIHYNFTDANIEETKN